MSSQLEELWLELFNQNITPIEASLLTAVDRKVDSDSPILILASLMVRMQYLVLVENKDSPFRALASVRRTMDEHRRSVEQISETYRMLKLNLSEWNGILARTENEFYELREFGRAAFISRALTYGEEDSRAVPKFIRRMMYLLWGGCFFGAGTGAVLVSVILKLRVTYAHGGEMLRGGLMADWRVGDGHETHDRFSLAIFNSLKTALAAFGDRNFAIASIRTISSRGSDFRDAIVELALPGNVSIAIDYLAVPQGELAFDGPCDFDENVSEVVDIVTHFVASCQWHTFDKIVELFRDARQKSLLITDQPLEGDRPSFELLNLRLSYTDFWRHTSELGIKVTYSSLDDWLQPIIIPDKYYDLNHALHKLQDAQTRFAKRSAARERLKNHGASGEIDLLAFNLLARNGDLFYQLKCQPNQAPGESEIGVECGRVFAWSSISSAPLVTIYKNKIWVYGPHLPESAMLRANGKPIGDIIQCSLFSQDMAIVKVRNEIDFNATRIAFEIRQPKLLYCSSTGRFWPQQDA